MPEDDRFVACGGKRAAGAGYAPRRVIVAAARGRLDAADAVRTPGGPPIAPELLADVERAVALASLWGDVDAVREFAVEIARREAVGTWRRAATVRFPERFDVRILCLPIATYAVVTGSGWRRGVYLGLTTRVAKAVEDGAQGDEAGRRRLRELVVEPLVPSGTYGDEYVIEANGPLAGLDYADLLPKPPPPPIQPR